MSAAPTLSSAAAQLVVPRPLRRPVAVLAALGFAGLAVLAARYGNTDEAGRLDTRADARISGLEAGTPLEYVQPFGGPVPVVIAAVLLAVVCLALGRRRLAVVAVLGPALTGLATTLLKPLIGRTFNGGGFALPSGHTGGATAVAAVAALLVIGMAAPRIGTAVAAGVGVLAVGALMGSSLVIRQVHYATDTVAGFCTAVAVVGSVALLVDAVAAFHHDRREGGRLR